MTIIEKKEIACQIFTDELPAVLPEEYRDIDITWLDAGLHWNLDKLEIIKDADQVEKFLVQKRFARSISGHQETIAHFQDFTVCAIRFHP